MKDYNIATLFEIAFGIKNFAMYRPESVDSKPESPSFNYQGINIVEDVAEASRLSHLGTPILYPIKFKGSPYQFYTTSGELETFPVEDFELPAATLVNFRRAKILSQTTAVAGNGTVKELYGFNDWVIDIRGICLRDPSHPTAKTAYDQHLKLVEWDNIADSITVVGDLFADKDIGNLVIKEMDFKQVQGKPGVIPFFARCISDQPIELFL